jgi:hypothetical protein
MPQFLRLKFQDEHIERNSKNRLELDENLYVYKLRKTLMTKKFVWHLFVLFTYGSTKIQRHYNMR